MEGFMDTSASFYDIYATESDEEVFSLSPSPEISLEWESSGCEFEFNFEQENIVNNFLLEQTQALQPLVQPLQPIPPIQPILSQLPLISCQQPTKATDELSVVVLQKKRGNGGICQPIQQGERIRVDKTKGKLVKLLVKSNGLPVNFADNSWNLQPFLVDNARPDVMIPQGEGFAIAPSRPTKGATDETAKEFKLKLTKISKSQYFYVSATKHSECNTQQLSGRSLEFRSDDNGKVMNPKKRTRYAMESSSPIIIPASHTSSPSAGLSPTQTSNLQHVAPELADFIARSLVPVILDSFQAQLNTNVNTSSLEDKITKRIKLAFPTPSATASV